MREADIMSIRSNASVGILLGICLTAWAGGCSGDDDDQTSGRSSPAPVSPSPSEAPGPTPTLWPARTPTPGAATPAPTPVVETSPTPVREPTPTPQAEPTPTPVREPTPTPRAEPTPTPVREPTPTLPVSVTPTPQEYATSTPAIVATATPGGGGTPTYPPSSTATPFPDQDGDGYSVLEDCDDGDAAVYPGAPELCDGLDNDCDVDVDEDVQVLFYADADGDGYGTEASTTLDCDPPPGYAAVAEDCDDTDPTINPGADEACDGLDNDCDGAVDEGVTATFYLDADGDGYGVDAETAGACEAPEGYAEVGGDCDDGDQEVHPGALETCNHQDDDCDGQVDEGLPVSSYYLDSDVDGYGAGEAVEDCAAPEGYALKYGDCDDEEPLAYPGARESCDGLDNDCDGTGDHFESWFLDEFDTQALDPCWEIISPNPDSVVWQDSGEGVLTLVASPLNGGSDYFDTTNYDAPRVLHTAPAGDWTVSVRLRFDPTQNYQGAGILICFADGDDTDCWRVAERSYYPPGGGSVVHVVGDYVRYSEPEVFLKVEKRGDDYTGWFKASESDSWTQNGTKSNTGPVGRIGVFAIRQAWDGDLATYSLADFDWYELSP